MFLNIRFDIGEDAFDEVLDGLLILIHVDGLCSTKGLVRLNERRKFCFNSQLRF